MSYDPNSLEEQKGALGEKIVKDLITSARLNVTVEKPADTFKSGASVVDFVIKNGRGDIAFLICSSILAAASAFAAL